MIAIRNSSKVHAGIYGLIMSLFIVGSFQMLPALITVISILVLTVLVLGLTFAPTVIQIGRPKRKFVESQRTPKIPEAWLPAKELRELSVMFQDVTLHQMADEAEAREKAEAEAAAKKKEEETRPAYISVTPKITPPAGGGGVVTSRQGSPKPKPDRSPPAIAASCYDLVRRLPDVYQAPYLKSLGSAGTGTQDLQRLKLTALENELADLVKEFDEAESESWVTRAKDHQRQELRRIEQERKRTKTAQAEMEKLFDADPGAAWLIPEENPDECEARLFNELCDLAEKYNSPELHRKLAAVIDLDSQTERLEKYREYISILKTSNTIRKSTPTTAAEIKKNLLRKPLGGLAIGCSCPVVGEVADGWGNVVRVDRQHNRDCATAAWQRASDYTNQLELDLEDIKRSLEAAGARTKRR